MKKIISIMMLVSLCIGCSNANLSKYSWGDALQSVLDEIGVEKIEKVTDESSETTKDIVANVLVETDLRSLDALLSKNTDGTWDVLTIKDNEDDRIYYEIEHLQLNDDGTQKDTIYDYKLGSIVKKGIATCNADMESKKSKEEIKKEVESALKDYDVKFLDILTKSDGTGFIVSPQINANVNKEEALIIAEQIANKILPICDQYYIEIINDNKLILFIDQDGNTNQ